MTTTRLDDRPVSPARSRRLRRPDRATAAAAVLIVAGVAFRLYLLLAEAVPGNSDEATTGLTALHIALGRGLPAYFYGQHYMGALESYLAAPLFAAFGSSLLLLRLPPLLLHAVFCVAMYALTTRLYTRWFAVAVVGLLALGAPAVVHGQLLAGGGYPELKPFAAALFLLAVRLGTEAAWTTGRRLVGFAAWGLLAGLAMWDDWLIAPFIGGAGLVLLVGCRRALLGWPGAALVAGAVVGALPMIVHNLQAGPGEDTLSSLLAISGNGHATAWAKLYGGVLLGIPLGTGLCPPGQCESWALGWGVVYPVLLVLAAASALAALRRGRRVSADTVGADTPGGGSDERVRQVARLGLVLAGALIILAYARSEPAGLVPTTSVRYLSPLMVCVPAVLWPLWSAADRLRRGDRPGDARALAGGALGGALFVAFVVSLVAGTVGMFQAIPDGQAHARNERRLIATLDRLQITRFYTEYWTCNRLAFATRERLVCATISDDLHPGFDRLPPYQRAVAAEPNPPYVLPVQSAVDRAFADRLRAQGNAVEVTEVPGYRIYRPSAPVGIPIR